MITADGSVFELHTARTSYIFRRLDTGHLEHLYYGKRDGTAGRVGPTAPDGCGSLTRESAVLPETGRVNVAAPGNTVSYDENHLNFSLENTCLEMSSYGKGDLREPFVEIVYPDGSATSDFLYENAVILKDKPPYETLPGSYGLPEHEHLTVTLKEAVYGLYLELHYYVYEDADVICRSARLINKGPESVRVERLMSLMLDLEETGLVMTSFTGSWAHEMERHDTAVEAGTLSVSSVCGYSSNRANPFFMLSRPGTSENAGVCFGFNLIYSGNHFEAVQVSPFGRTRVVSGINPVGFSWELAPGGIFEAPEAVMTYSAKGHARLSLNMHQFIREHIIRGSWKHRERPVLINSWEAFYFDYDETDLLRLAQKASEVGIELFVLDDGWFGKRNDETSSLGDWYPNPGRFPGGLREFAVKLKEMGLFFGIWTEPEMVSVDSDLYRVHPEWVMEIPGRPHSEGRNQRILDLSNPEVVDYLTGVLTGLFSSAGISYVKWDLNRVFSDVYSKAPNRRQGETAHRYMIGLYTLLERITGMFPDILFEGCAAGGGRFDLGMLSYFPQIWGSDNTDPVCRAAIQDGYSYGYPPSAVGAHVSASPNHQTGRVTPLETRFNAALSGSLGYELNLLELSQDELDEIKKQIEIYKKLRARLKDGDFYRMNTESEYGFYVLPKEGGEAPAVKLTGTSTGHFVTGDALRK